MLKLSAWLALAVGLALGGAQLLRNWDNLTNWPTWGMDLAAAALLVFAGERQLRAGSGRFLAGAWGLALGLYVSSFVSHQQVLAQAALGGPLHATEQMFSAVTGGLALTALAGLCLSMSARRTG